MKTTANTTPTGAHRRSARALSAITAVAGAAALFVVPGSAAAAPAKQVKTASATHQVSPATLGISKSLTLSNLSLDGDVVLPSIPGVTWTGVKTAIHWPSAMTSGSVQASAGTRKLTEISAHGASTKADPFVITTAGAVSGSDYEVNFNGNVNYSPAAAHCTAVSNASLNPYAYAPTIDITSISYKLTGSNKTVGSYLQGPVSHLIFRLPADAPTATKQALLQLESKLVAGDANTNVAVAVDSTSKPAPAASFFTRVITFAGGTSKRGNISVSDAGMVISGDGAATVRQVALLDQSTSGLLQSSTASSSSADSTSGTAITSDTTGAPDTMSLTQLGVGGLTAAGWGDFSIGLGFTQAATGAEVQGANYTLRGTNSAVAHGAGATITLFDGNMPLQSQTLRTGKDWALSGTVPATSIGRGLDLRLQVQYVSSAGRCNALPPITVAVSPTSGFTFTRGPSLETGFQDLPQMLMPSVAVVLSQPSSFAQFQQAAGLLAGAQRLTSTQLNVAFNGSATLPSGPSIVVAGGGSALNQELEPVALTQSTVQFSDGKNFTNIRLGQQIAFLTAGRRPSGAAVLALLYPRHRPDRGAALLAGLGGNQQRWYGLTGNTAVLAASGQIATSLVGLSATVTLAQVATTWLSYRWVWGFLGALAVVIVLMLLALGRRLTGSEAGRDSGERRRRSDDPGNAHSGGSGADTPDHGGPEWLTRDRRRPA